MTLLTIYNIFEDAVQYNPFLKTFESSELFLFNKTDNVEYPLLFLETPRLTTNKNVQTYDVNFIVADRVLENQKNEKEILSKTKQIGESVLQFLYNNYKEVYNNYQYNAIPFIDNATDRVWGWRFEITLKVVEFINCKDVYTFIPQPPFEPCPLADVIDITVNDIELDWEIGNQDYTLLINEQIPLGLFVEWSLDNFDTIESIGTSFSSQINTSTTQSVTLYFRTSNGEDVGNVGTVEVKLKDYVQNSWVFDGVNDQINNTNWPQMDIGLIGDFTVEMFLEFNMLQTLQVFFSKFSNVDGLVIYTNNNNTIRVECNSVNNINRSLNSNIAVTTNTKYHLVFRYQPYPDRAELLINAVQVGSLASPNGSIARPIGVSIGGYTPVGNLPFNGNIYTTRIYNKFLTNQDIEDLYNNGDGTYPLVTLLDDLVYYIEFDSNNNIILPNPILPDKSANQLFGVGQNFTTNPVN